MKGVILVFSALVVTLIVGYLGWRYIFVADTMSKTSRSKALEQEAVWIARYLDTSDYSLERVNSELQNERGITIDLGHWHMVHESPNKADSDQIILLYSKEVDGNYIIIRKSLYIDWLSENDLIGEGVEINDLVSQLKEPAKPEAEEKLEGRSGDR